MCHPEAEVVHPELTLTLWLFLVVLTCQLLVHLCICNPLPAPKPMSGTMWEPYKDSSSQEPKLYKSGTAGLSEAKLKRTWMSSKKKLASCFCLISNNWLISSAVDSKCSHPLPGCSDSFLHMIPWCLWRTAGIAPPPLSRF